MKILRCYTYVFILLFVACGDRDDAGVRVANAILSEQEIGGAKTAALLSEAIHDFETPAAGTAVVKVGGVTYHFDELQTCGIDRNGEIERFKAEGKGTLGDGRRTEFEMSRRINNSEKIASGDRHEHDFVRISAHVDVPGGNLQNLWITSQAGSRRTQPGDDVWREYGRDTPLPFVLIRENSPGVTATASANLSRQRIVPEAYDQLNLDEILGEGSAEFAVTCE
ncbi:MAG: hypothetical protein JJU37_13325 [Balneolaceae bacterium]|nr:hypothetical protein [Balneolaceae bacterium]